MKNLKLMSVMKHLSVAALGAVLALGVLILPRFTVNAEQDFTVKLENGVLTLSGKLPVVTDTDGIGILSYDVNHNNDASLVQSVVIENGTTLNANSSYLFVNFVNIKSINFSNVSSTSNVTNMHSMFENCTSLESITLPTNGNWNTSNVTDMGTMFYKTAITDFGFLSSFNTENVTDMSNMFGACQLVSTIDLSGFETGNVIYMANMFDSDTALGKIIVPASWSTASVLDFSDMFKDCYNLVGGNGTIFDAGAYKSSTSYNKDLARIDTVDTPGLLSTANSITVYGQLFTDGGRFRFEISFPYDDSKNYEVTYGNENMTLEDKGDGKCYFEFQASAKELNDKKELVIKEDNIVVIKKTYSIADYLKKVYYSTTDSKIEAAAGSMLRYGGYAQILLKNNVPNYANNGVYNYDMDDSFYVIPPTASVYPDTTNPVSNIDPTNINNALESCGATYAGINLALDNELTFMMAFKLPVEARGDDGWNSWAKKDEFMQIVQDSCLCTLDSNSFSLDGGKNFAIVTITNINIKNLDQTLFDKGYYNCDISALAYVLRCISNQNTTPDQKNLCRALFEFYYRAKAL